MIQTTLGKLVMPATRSIKIDAELWRKIKIIVATQEPEIGMQDYINDVLRPAVNRDYPKALKKLNAGESKEGDK